MTSIYDSCTITLSWNGGSWQSQASSCSSSPLDDSLTIDNELTPPPLEFLPWPVSLTLNIETSDSAFLATVSCKMGDGAVDPPDPQLVSNDSVASWTLTAIPTYGSVSFSILPEALPDSADDPCGPAIPPDPTINVKWSTRSRGVEP